MMTYEELNAIYRELRDMEEDAHYTVREQAENWNTETDHNMRRSRNITESYVKVSTLLEFMYKRAELDDDKATIYRIEEEAKKELKSAKRYYELIKKQA